MTEVNSHDIETLLFSTERDFLVRNNGDQVKIDSLRGKKIGLYFSASWYGPCRKFTPSLIEAYIELCPKGDFEIIFIFSDEDDESFHGYFSKMPWLAIPFSDSQIRDNLEKLLKVMEVPELVILDENGKVICDSGVEIIRDFEVEGYPFTPERIKELKEQDEAARKEQSLKSLLVYGSRDFVISNDGKKVPVSELEGKIVGLYFSSFSYGPCIDFTPKLVEAYEKIKAKGENFEIVLISCDGDDDDDEDESFKQAFEKVPWLSLPFKEICEKLTSYFDPATLPALVIIGKDGKTLHSNVVETIEEHGFMAYPFSPEKFAELEKIEKEREQRQTLESILVSGDQNFVIGKDGAKIPVSDLVGKNILLYFSAHWCPPCQYFLPKLTEAYHKINATNDALELIFISYDRDQTSFDEYFSSMPGLALPFGDGRKEYLSRKFKVSGIPKLIAIGPTGQTVTTAARERIGDHGPDAYPFTDERLKEIKAQQEEMAKEWPEKVKHTLHEEHELVLHSRKTYTCDACDEVGYAWSFFCKECGFHLHPKCALEEDKGTKAEANGEHNPKQG